MSKWKKEKSDFWVTNGEWLFGRANGGYVKTTYSFLGDDEKFQDIKYIDSYTGSQLICFRFHTGEVGVYFSDKSIYLKTNDKDKLKDLIQLIDGYNSLDEIKEEIFEYVGIKTGKEILQEMQTLFDKGEIKQATNLAITAQTGKYFNVIWELAKLCHNNLMSEVPTIDPMALFELYAAVSDQNPHFKEANDQMLHLLYTQKTSQGEKILFQEEMLRCAVNSKNQTLVDQMFHELCGNKGLNPDIKDIKADPETLIAIAEKIRALKYQIEELKSYKARKEAAKSAEQRFKFLKNNEEVYIDVSSKETLPTQEEIQLNYATSESIKMNEMHINYSEKKELSEGKEEEDEASARQVYSPGK